MVICLHAVILFVGAYYTSAEVPLFSRRRDGYELALHHYDCIGHFAQGC